MTDQRLYRIDRSTRYQHIEPLFSGTLNQDLILRRWDDLLRVAGLVKMGWVTASLLIGKLQSYRRQTGSHACEEAPQVDRNKGWC